MVLLITIIEIIPFISSRSQPTTMKRPSTATTITLLVASCSIWEGVSGLAAVNRRTFWTNIGAGAAVAFAPRAAEAAEAFDLYTFNNQYDDPDHPNCKRIVKVKQDGVAMISGTEGKPACPEDGMGEIWRLVGTAEGKEINGRKIYVDMSDADGPNEMNGVWDGDGIKWSDGKKWYIKGMMPKASPEEASTNEASTNEAKES